MEKHRGCTRIEYAGTMVNRQYLDSLSAASINTAVAAEDDLADILLADLGNHPSGFREVNQTIDGLEDIGYEEPCRMG